MTELQIECNARNANKDTERKNGWHTEKYENVYQIYTTFNKQIQNEALSHCFLKLSITKLHTTGGLIN